MKSLLMSWLYNLLLLLFCLVDFTKWLFFLVKLAISQLGFRTLSQHEKREWAWGQKFGLVRCEAMQCKLSPQRLLVHCASVGEVVAAMPMIRQLIAEHPQLNIVVSTNTLTGKQQLLRMLDNDIKDKVFHSYFPIDLPWLMASLLRQIKPQAVIIMEVELWLNLINQCAKRRIPVSVVNARLTDKTTRGYRKLRHLAIPMIQQLSLVFARNQTDYDNYLSLGLAKDKLFLYGNIKFDVGLPSATQAKLLRTQLNLDNRTVVIGGSTHLGEEALLVGAYQQLKSSFPELLLLIAPRHPHRFEEVAKYLNSCDLVTKKMSLNEQVDTETDVLLGDQMGQLSKLYGVCDIAFVGGSIANKGGHNPIEPASFAKPVLMGPHLQNNPEITDALIGGNGLKVITDQHELTQQLTEWLLQPQLRTKTGEDGLAVLTSHSGIIVKVVKQIGDLATIQR